MRRSACRTIAVVEGLRSGAKCLAFSPDGRYLAEARRVDNQVWTFDLAEEQRVAESGKLVDVEFRHRHSFHAARGLSTGRTAARDYSGLANSQDGKC